MSWTRQRFIQWISILALLSGIGAFQIATIRPNPNWGSDSSLYVMHARNIVEGRGYADTGYIYNPSFPEHSPRAYPPLYPLLLAPLYKYFGLNSYPMKVEGIVFLLLSLLMLFLLLQDELPFPYSLLVIALAGFNPVFWNFKDEVLPDTAFMFFAYLSMYVIQRSYRAAGTNILVRGVLIGVSIYLACATRSIGLVLIPALLAYDFSRNKRITWLAALGTGVACSLVLAQNALVHNDSSYLEQLRHKLAPMLYYVNAYLYALVELWNNGVSKIIRDVLCAIWTAAAITGLISLIRRRANLIVIFTVLYTAALMVWPGGGGGRYILPIVPLYFTYILIGITRMPWARSLGAKRTAVALFAGTAFASYLGAYVVQDYGPGQGWLPNRDFTALCSYIQDQTPPESVFVSVNPRVLALFTGRRASVYEYTEDVGGLWRYFQSIGARYLVVTLSVPEDQKFLRPFVAQYRNALVLEYHNPEFELYRLTTDAERTPAGSKASR